jgi:hypothetical protein
MDRNGVGKVHPDCRFKVHLTGIKASFSAEKGSNSTLRHFLHQINTAKKRIFFLKKLIDGVAVN